jgi:phosphopantothenoylcysteine decarboxylase/phosphopantothenate--cysteine ligase
VIELEKTKDILASLGKDKKISFNGFALETENEIENAKVKSRKT